MAEPVLVVASRSRAQVVKVQERGGIRLTRWATSPMPRLHLGAHFHACDAISGRAIPREGAGVGIHQSAVDSGEVLTSSMITDILSRYVFGRTVSERETGDSPRLFRLW